MTKTNNTKKIPVFDDPRKLREFLINNPDSETVDVRYDFDFFFDANHCNPNGDPDADNRPRTDSFGFGKVTQESLKRKMRDWICNELRGIKGYDIHIRKSSTLSTATEALRDKVAKAHGVTLKKDDSDSDGKDSEKQTIKNDKKVAISNEAAAELCKEFFDDRAFGIVIGTNYVDSIWGAAQVYEAFSVEPVTIDTKTVTRIAAASEKDAEGKKANQTMGRKYDIPYALYHGTASINPHQCKKCNFTYNDLVVFVNALLFCFANTESSSRANMDMIKVYMFEHNNSGGCSHPSTLHDLIKVSKTCGDRAAIRRADYKIEIDESGVPGNITLHELL